MARDTRLRCKHCCGVIQSDIYAHWRMHINGKVHSFCRQICVDAFLDRSVAGADSIRKVMGDEEGKEEVKDDKDEANMPIKNRWSILDL